MQKFIITSLLAIAVLVSGGCVKQSVFNYDDIKGRTVLTGEILYTPGYELETSGYYPSAITMPDKPAANAIVKVIVANSEYLGQSSASGSKCYSTETDYEGHFSISIPAIENNSMSVSLFVDYTGSYNALDYDDTGSRIIVKKNGVKFYRYGYTKDVYQQCNNFVTLTLNQMLQ